MVTSTSSKTREKFPGQATNEQDKTEQGNPYSNVTGTGGTGALAHVASVTTTTLRTSQAVQTTIRGEKTIAGSYFHGRLLWG